MLLFNTFGTTKASSTIGCNPNEMMFNEFQVKLVVSCITWDFRRL